jgi:Outer membrane protein beta-barrel domain
MRFQKVTLAAILAFFIPLAWSQNFEITGQVGGQFNGGLDMSTSFFNRIDVGNGLNYGVTLGYLFGERYGVEFQWNHNSAETFAKSSGGPDIKVFNLTTNQYMGNFVYHFADRDKKLRPFVFGGLGAASLGPDVSSVPGVTRFVFGVGGGAKYNLSPHFGLRGQAKWSPTYITTTDGGFWCDPFWGGCWLVGNDHYLHEFDITGGITFRF